MSTYPMSADEIVRCVVCNVTLPEGGNGLCDEHQYDRPTLLEEAERLLSYWEQHGDNPEVVAKWAVSDMLGILRFIIEEQA